MTTTNPTPANLAAKMSAMLDSWRTFIAQSAAWAGGSTSGGPNADGLYPLTDDLGDTSLIPSPAKLAQMVSGPVDSALSYRDQAATHAATAAAHVTTVTNAKNSANTYATTAQQQATLAGTYADQAGSHAAAARADAVAADAAKTASEAVLAEVQQGLQETSDAVANVIADATAAGAAQVALAETARTAAQTARTGAETAKAGADTAKTAAETARTDAQTAASQAAASAASVNDTNLVHRTGDENIGGNKVFTSNAVRVNATAGSNAHYWLRDENGVFKGLLYWDRAGSRIRLRRYNADGSAAEGELALSATDLQWNAQPVLLGTVTNTADATPLPDTYTPFIATGSMLAGAPTGGAATHLTWRSNSDNRVAQLVTSNAGGAGNPDIYFRTHHTSDNGGGWTTFAKLWHSRARRLVADFNNADRTLRTYFQPSATGGTSVGILTNTGTSSYVEAYNGSDPANAGSASFGVAVNDAIISMSKTGTGTTPTAVSFRWDGVEKLRLTNAGLIQGDFSNAPGTRVGVKSSVANGVTSLDTIPNGTSKVSGFTALNSSDPVNTGYAQVIVNDLTMWVHASKLGTGVAPNKIAFVFEGVEKAGFNNAGDLSLQGGLVSWSNGISAKVGAAGANGYVAMVPGSTGVRPGYIAFHSAEGTRRGYIGWGDGTNMLDLMAENGFGWKVNGTKFEVVGAVYSTGTGAALYAYDRTTARTWAWYGQGDNFRLFNGSGDIIVTDASGNLTAATLRPSGSNGAHLSGNGSGMQYNGLSYFASTMHQLHASANGWSRIPRIFVGGGDPGAAASDGDLWIT